MTAGCCGCWPSGAGTTVPGCARGTGAGAVGRCAVCEAGHGGSGVLEQAVSKTAASTAEAFHGIHRSGFCLAAAVEESEDPRFAKMCMVMVVGADGCDAGWRLLRGCYLRVPVLLCQRTSRCKGSLDKRKPVRLLKSWRVLRRGNCARGPCAWRSRCLHFYAQQGPHKAVV